MISDVNTMSRTQLISAVRDYRGDVQNGDGIAFKKSQKEQIDFFMGCLDKAPEASLADLKSCASKHAAKMGKIASVLDMAGWGLMIAAFVAPVPAAVAPYRLIGGLVGMMACNTASGVFSMKAQTSATFASQLNEFGHYLDAKQPQPTPAPAPAPAPSPDQPTPSKPAPAPSQTAIS